ncbi:uncharacterized protein TNCV_1867891 [Trichonephila clavipes]|nr:uncharacterized protein TNCV_1867891 [Trichonephila clavipes]
MRDAGNGPRNFELRSRYENKFEFTLPLQSSASQQIGQSKHKVGACGVNNQASAVLAGNELPFVAFSLSPDGHGYELVSSVRDLVPQKFRVEEELMHVKHVDVKSPHVGVMWKFGRGVISSGESTKLPFVFEAVREIYRSIFGVASFKKVDRFRSEIQLAGKPVRGLRSNPHNHAVVANSWFLCKQDAISHEIPLKIKMERLKFKLEIVEALSASPPNNKSISTDDEDNNVLVPLEKSPKCYYLPAMHVMYFILAIPG